MIKNFLKDGSEIKDLNGHVVKETDAPELYRILDRIQKGETNERNNHGMGN